MEWCTATAFGIQSTSQEYLGFLTLLCRSSIASGREFPVLPSNVPALKLLDALSASARGRGCDIDHSNARSSFSTLLPLDQSRIQMDPPVWVPIRPATKLPHLPLLTFQFCDHYSWDCTLSLFYYTAYRARPAYRGSRALF